MVSSIHGSWFSRRLIGGNGTRVFIFVDTDAKIESVLLLQRELKKCNMLLKERAPPRLVCF